MLLSLISPCGDLAGHCEEGRGGVQGCQEPRGARADGDIRGVPEEDGAHHRRLHPQPAQPGAPGQAAASLCSWESQPGSDGQRLCQGLQQLVPAVTGH